MDYRLQSAYGIYNQSGRQQDIRTSYHLYARYMTAAVLWIASDSFLVYQELFEEVRKLIIDESDWLSETNQMFINAVRSYELYIDEKEEILLSKDYRSEIEQELLRLNRIAVSDLGIGMPSNSLIIEIKEAVQKGNRTNFKLIQELQQKLEELTEGSIGDQSEKARETNEVAIRKTNELTILLLDTFDLLELVRISALVKEDKLWDKELNLVIEKALGMLSEYGLEEIQVLDQLFDGEIMEGITTVPLDGLPSGYQKYQVYAVTQRGFCHKQSKKLVRKAKVTTVY